MKHEYDGSAVAFWLFILIFSVSIWVLAAFGLVCLIERFNL